MGKVLTFDDAVRENNSISQWAQRTQTVLDVELAVDSVVVWLYVYCYAFPESSGLHRWPWSHVCKVAESRSPLFSC